MISSLAELRVYTARVPGSIPGSSTRREVIQVKAVVASLCAYELAAILTGKAPTITALNRRYRFIEPVILAGLFVHFRNSHR